MLSVNKLELWIFKIDTLRKSLKQLFKKVILLFMLYSTTHTNSVILIPLLVCSYLYDHGNSNIKNQYCKKRHPNERILSDLKNKGATNWDEKTVNKVLCLLRAKNLLNSNDIAESAVNWIPNLPTADIVHIKPVELGKDVQSNYLNF